jgi:hypothetical protein
MDDNPDAVDAPLVELLERVHVDLVVDAAMR